MNLPRELLIEWSARVFVLLYLVRLAIDAVSAGPRGEKWALRIWTAAFAVYVLHVVFAFQFLHHWSHAAAVSHAARRTFEVVGLAWGQAILVNYAFTVLWLADVVLWWRRSLRGERTPASQYWALQAVFLFMMFNATVVFGPPFWKWVACATVAALLLARLILRRPSQDETTEDETTASEPLRTL